MAERSLQNGQIVLQFDKTGTGDLDYEDLSHRYLWGPGIDMLLADEQVDGSDEQADGPVFWMLTDHLGSVRDVVDNNGTVRRHNKFDSYGRLTGVDYYDEDGDPINEAHAEAIDQLFGYTGRPLDEYTGLQNNRARWYATLGKFGRDAAQRVAGRSQLPRSLTLQNPGAVSSRTCRAVGMKRATLFASDFGRTTAGEWMD